MDGTDVMDVGAELGTGGILGDLGGQAVETPEFDTGGNEFDTSNQEEIVNQVDQPEREPEEQQKPDQNKQRLDQQRTAITKYLRELRQNADLKEIADALNKSYFRDQEYSSLGPVQELRQLKNEIDIMGGVDAVRQARDLSLAVERIDAMVDSGDPQVVEDMSSESPEGFKKIVPAAIDKLRQMDAVKYAEVLKPHLVRSLQQSGLGSTVTGVADLLQRAYQSSDPLHSRFYMEQAFNQLNSINGWLDGLGKELETASNQPQMQPNQVQAPSGGIDQGKIQQELSEWARPEFVKALQPFMKGRNLNEGAVNGLISLLAMEVDNRLTADSNIQSNLNAWQMAGKADKVVQTAKIGIQQVLGEAARAVWERQYGNQPVRQQQPAQRQPQQQQKPAQQSNKPMLLPKKPSIDQLDMSRDPERTLFIAHRGYLKDGRLVQWK